MAWNLARPICRKSGKWNRFNFGSACQNQGTSPPDFGLIEWNENAKHFSINQGIKKNRARMEPAIKFPSPSVPDESEWRQIRESAPDWAA